MRPRRSSRGTRWYVQGAARLFLLSSCLLAPSSSWAQAAAGPRILHDGLRCVVAGRHPIIEALVEPADDLVTVKAYFRAAFSPLFYFVEMSRDGDRFRGVLPKPSREVQSMVYYLEAVDSTFNSLRTEEFHPRVAAELSDCENDGPPAAYLEGPGNITVGATAPGPNFPVGFLPDGIVGTISAAGRAAAGGGGIGSSTLVAVGAAAAGAVGVGVLVGKGGEVATTTAISGNGNVTTSSLSTTTSALTTSIPPIGGVVTACFDTEPNPPVITVGTAVRFDASCSKPDRDQIASYVWDFNDGRDSKEGRVVNRVYNDPGVFPAELTVTDIYGNHNRTSTNVQVQEVSAPPPAPGPGPGPGPTTTVPGSADLQITAFSGPPTRAIGANANYSVSYRNNGPDLDPTVTVVTVFSASGAGGAPTAVSTPGCGTSSGGGSLTVSCFIGSLGSAGTGSLALTVRFPSADTYQVSTSIFGGTSDPAPGNNGGGTIATAVSLKANTAAPLEAAFVTEIQSSTRGQVQASLELNGTETSVADDTGPRRQVMKARTGRNIVVGYAAGANLDGALWRIDFSRSRHFRPGSLVVEAGDVVSLDAYRVVFRLSSGAPRVRFQFQMDP